MVSVPLTAEEKSRVVPDKHRVVLQVLDNGSAAVDTVQALPAVPTTKLKINKCISYVIKQSIMGYMANR